MLVIVFFHPKIGFNDHLTFGLIETFSHDPHKTLGNNNKQHTYANTWNEMIKKKRNTIFFREYIFRAVNLVPLYWDMSFC